MSTLYAVRSTPTGYRMMKFDGLLNFETVYDMRQTSHHLYCSCPAAGKNHDCKHRQMVNLFIARGRMNKGWFYDYDKGKWEKPLKIWS